MQRIVKDAKRCCKEEGSEGRRGRKKEVETQAQTVLTLGLDRITKFVYRLDGPLGEGNV
jgi:ribosomal protein L30/L7E